MVAQQNLLKKIFGKAFFRKKWENLILEGFLAKLTKKNFSPENIIFFGRNWMLKQGGR